MNKKGFTMIELLATMVILGILSTIGVVSVTRYIRQSKVKSYKLMSESVYEAAYNCIVQTKCSVPTSISSPIEYSTEELKTFKFLKKLENPGNKNSECEGSVKIYLSEDNDSEYKKYNYQVTLKCPGVSKATLVWPYSKTADTNEINRIIDEAKY